MAPRGGAQVRVFSGYSRGSAFVRVAPRIIGSRGFGFSSQRFYRPYYSFRPRISLGFGLWAGYPVSYPYYYDYPYSYGYPYPADPYAYGYPAASYAYPSVNQPSGYPPSSYPPSSYSGSGYPASGYPASGYPADNSVAPRYAPQQPATGSVGVQPGGQQPDSGGVSFEITPSTAAVFVDGTYVGTSADFGPSSQPLGLIPGRHHIEVRASGYQTMSFDADVTAGQVIPYQGTLQAAQRKY